MKERLSKIQLSFFQKNILRMLKGTTIAQGVGFLGSIILAKIYGADAFGLFGVYISLTAIFSVFNTLQLDYGIVLEEDEKAGLNLLSTLLFLSIILGSILFLIYNLLYPITSQYFSFCLILISILSSIFLAQNKSLEAFFTKNKKYNLLANGKIILSISTVISQFILFHLLHENGLIIGSLIAFIITFFFYLKNSVNKIKKPNIKLLKNTIKKHKNLLRFALPSNLTNALSINIMPLLIFTFFTEKEVGAYTLSTKILMSPLLLISASISQVYFQEATELFQNKKKDLFDFTKKISRNIFLITLGIILLINTIGLEILSYFFDKDWNYLIPFTWGLSFLILARSIFNPISHIILITDKNQIGFIFNIYLLIINLIGIYTGYSYGNIMYSIYILSFGGGLGYFLLYFYFMSVLKSYKNT